VQRAVSASAPAAIAPTNATSPIPVRPSADSGPVGRMEMPPALTLPGVPAPPDAPARADATAVADTPPLDTTTSRSEVAADVAEVAAANTVGADETPAGPLLGSVTVSRLAESTSPPSIADPTSVSTPPQVEPTVANSSLRGVDGGPPTNVIGSGRSSDASHRRIGLGEPLPAGVPVQRASVPPTPTPGPAATPHPIDMPVAASGIPTPSRASADKSPNEPGDAPIAMARALSVQRAMRPLPPSGDDGESAHAQSRFTLAPLIGGAPTLIPSRGGEAVAQRIESFAPSTPTGSPATPHGIDVSRTAAAMPMTPVHGPAATTSGFLPTDSAWSGLAPTDVTAPNFMTPDVTAPNFTAPGGVEAPAVTAQRSAVGVPVSSLPLSTASWVSPSVQRLGLPSMPSVPSASGLTDQATRAADSARSTVASARDAASSVESTAGHAAADAGHAVADAQHAVADPGHAAMGALGDPAAMVAHFFDPLLARLKTELRLDRERRGSLTDLWH
jgi:hypothetical protein